jgi:hypothetical protein
VTAPTTDEWAEAARAEFATLAGAPTLAGTVQVDVTAGSAAGALTVRATFDAGRLTGFGVGPAETPDAILTLTGADAVAVAGGDLAPSVAFMQGRMKVAGDMGLVLDLLALSATTAAGEARARLAARGGR